MHQAAVMDSPLSQLPSQTIDGESSLSGQFSEYEEAESGKNVGCLLRLSIMIMKILHRKK